MMRSRLHLTWILGLVVFSPIAHASDLEVESALTEAGYTCNAENLEVNLRENEVEVKEVRESACSSPRILVKAALILSSLYVERHSVGGEFSVYLRPARQRHFMLSTDVNWTRSDEVQQGSISIDYNYRHSGLFAGVNQQMFLITNPLTAERQVYRLYATGLEAGWRKSFGPQGRFQVGLKVSVARARAAGYGTEYYKTFTLREARLSLGVLLFKR